MRYDTQLKNCKLAFKHCKLLSTHYMHQWKGQNLRAGESEGLSRDERDAMAHRQGDVLKESYEVGISTRPAVLAAGGDIEHTRQHVNPQLSIAATEAEKRTAIFELVPMLLSAEQQVKEAVAAVQEAQGKMRRGRKQASGGKAMADARLHSAQGALRALMRMAWIFICQSAARPRDENMQIIEGSKPLYLEGAEYNAVYRQLAFFRGKTFLEVVTKVKAAEDAFEAGLVVRARSLPLLSLPQHAFSRIATSHAASFSSSPPFSLPNSWSSPPP